MQDWFQLNYEILIQFELFILSDAFYPFFDISLGPKQQ